MFVFQAAITCGSLKWEYLQYLTNGRINVKDFGPAWDIDNKASDSKTQIIANLRAAITGVETTRNREAIALLEIALKDLKSLSHSRLLHPSNREV